MVLATMNITKALDEKGVPIEPGLKYKSLVVKSVYSCYSAPGWTSGLTITFTALPSPSSAQSPRARRKQMR